MPVSMPNQPGSESATTQASALFERLRTDILACVYSPGQKLRLEMLRRSYGVGASPIREALNRLVAEGIVTQVDQKGFRVTPLTSAELVDLTRARCWLGDRALGESMRNGDAEWEERVLLAFHRWERGLRQTSSPAYVHDPKLHQLHKDFHAAMMSACGSEWFLKFWNDSFDVAQRYLVFSLKHGGAPERDPIGEHRALRDAVLARDQERALRLHSEHITLTADVVAQIGEAEGIYEFPSRLSLVRKRKPNM